MTFRKQFFSLAYVFYGYSYQNQSEWKLFQCAFDMTEEIMIKKGVIKSKDRLGFMGRDAFIRLAVLQSVIMREKKEKITEHVKNIPMWKLDSNKKQQFVHKVIAFAERIGSSGLLAQCLQKIILLVGSVDDKSLVALAFLMVRNCRFVERDYLETLLGSTLQQINLEEVKMDPTFLQLYYEYCKLTRSLPNFKTVLSTCISSVESFILSSLNDIQRHKEYLLRLYSMGAVKSVEECERKQFENRLRDILDTFKCRPCVKTLLKSVVNKEENQRWGTRMRNITIMKQKDPSWLSKWLNPPVLLPINFRNSEKECISGESPPLRNRITNGMINQLKDNPKFIARDHQSEAKPKRLYNIHLRKNIELRSPLNSRAIRIRVKDNFCASSQISTKPSMESDLNSGNSDEKIKSANGPETQLQQSLELKEQEESSIHAAIDQYFQQISESIVIEDLLPLESQNYSIQPQDIAYPLIQAQLNAIINHLSNENGQLLPIIEETEEQISLSGADQYDCQFDSCISSQESSQSECVVWSNVDINIGLVESNCSSAQKSSMHQEEVLRAFATEINVKALLRSIQVSLNINDIEKRIKMTLEERNRSEKAFDAVISVREIELGPKSQSLKQCCESSKQKSKPIGKIYLNGLPSHLNQKLRSNIEILVGANIQIDPTGNLQLNSEPTLDQVFQLLE